MDANVSVSPISAGVVTVTASAGSIPGISTSGTTQLNNLAVTGIGTFTSGLTVPSTDVQLQLDLTLLYHQTQMEVL